MPASTPTSTPRPPPARARRLAARLALAVPSLTLLAATTALVATASPHESLAVRVYGGPSRGPGPHALRLACVRHFVGVEDVAPLDDLSIEVGGHALRASCDEAGHADLRLPADPPLPERPRVVVRRGQRTLARGEADWSPSAWQRTFTARPSRVPLAASPAAPFGLLIDGGALSVGQRARAWLLGPSLPPTPPRALGLGAEVGPLAALDGGRGWAFDLRATYVQASLSFAPGPGDAGERWQAEARLPVIAGAPAVEAIAADDGSIKAIVRSPSGRSDAYARVIDREGRRYGARIPLTRRSPEGWPEGDLSAPSPPAEVPSWLVVSASVDGGPSLSLPLPLRAEPRDGMYTPDQLWIDGLVETLAGEAERRHRARWAVAALIASGALLEACLLLGLQRARTLVAFDPDADRLPLQPLGSGWLALALGVIWLGFVVVGILLSAGLG
jgi:hypothetical protein